MKITKFLSIFLFSLMVPFGAMASGGDLASMITNIAGIFSPIANALGQFAYVAGIAMFILAAILLRGYSAQQETNPKRAVGIAVCIIAGGWLVYLPSARDSSGEQMFDAKSQAGQSHSLSIE